jgi:hypothetical protein
LRQQLPFHFAADILFDGSEKWRFPDRQARLVVVEL